MSTGTFFSLENSLSFSSRGPSGRFYYFYKSKPTLVQDPFDILVFKSKSELFECDKNGNRLEPARQVNKAASFTKFDKRIEPLQIASAQKPEETIMDALRDASKKQEQEKLKDPEVQKRLQQIQSGELTEAQKLAMGMLEEEDTDAEEDLEEDDSEVKESKKKKIKSKGKFQCEKCGKKLKSQKEYDDHMELHEEDE